MYFKNKVKTEYVQTDLLFKKELIFRDHQLKRIQTTLVFQVQSLGFF